MPALEIFLLGSPHIKRDGKPVRIERRKAIALLAYLAVTNVTHSRDTLAALLWPDATAERARGDLRKAVWVLGEALGKECLEIGQEQLTFRRGPDVWLDVEQFNQHQCEVSRHDDLCGDCLTALAEAATLYHDGFMAGFSLRDSLAFDAWQSEQSEHFRHKYGTLLESLVRGYSAQGAYEPAITYAHRWLAHDPLHEPAHYLLMEIFARAGQRSAALRQYHQCAQLLDQELGIQPNEETRLLYDAIQNGQHAFPATAAVKQPASRPHNLPLQPTPFVGREDELAQINHLLDDPNCRLLTLTGVGGTGKTRLALQAAHVFSADANGRFPHGVFYIPLAPLMVADAVLPAIVDALQLQGSADPKVQLINYLRGKEMLLVLDNFEHLLEAEKLVTEILSSVSGVKLLVTSRERLNSSWEWPLEIRGLAYPERSDATSVEDCSAIDLFIQTATRANPNFRLLEEDFAAVIGICHSLNGLPLGIELAAAWVGSFSCSEIAHAIEQNLDLLATTLRDVPERHRSIKAAFDHSWLLLPESDRSVFRKLSVFRGGFGLAAAQAVADATLPILRSLVHKSLLHVIPEGRYEMIEVLRQYAEEKLDTSPSESVAAHNNHCEFYADFLHERDASLRLEGKPETIEEIRRDIDNVQAAWQWALGQKHRSAIDRSISSLHSYYRIQGMPRFGERALSEAVKTVEEIKALSDVPSDEVMRTLGRTLAFQGAFCESISLYEDARTLLQRSIAIFEALGLHTELSLPLRFLGTTLAKYGEFEASTACINRSLELSYEHNNRAGIASSLNSLGHVYFFLAQDYANARRLHLEALAIFRQLGNARSVVYCLEGLTYLALAQEDYAEAKRLTVESLSILGGVGKRRTAVNLALLGRAQDGLGEYAEAKRLYLESLVTFREIGDPWEISDTIMDLGYTLISLGEYQEARRCFREAWDIATGSQAVPMMLKVCLGVAMIFANQLAQADQVRATELAACTIQHPVAWPEEKERAKRILASMEQRLPPTDFLAAQQNIDAEEQFRAVAYLLADENVLIR